MNPAKKTASAKPVSVPKNKLQVRDLFPVGRMQKILRVMCLCCISFQNAVCMWIKILGLSFYFGDAYDKCSSFSCSHSPLDHVSEKVFVTANDMAVTKTLCGL